MKQIMKRGGAIGGLLIVMAGAGACASPIGPDLGEPSPPDTANCSLFAESQSSAYVLPFETGQVVPVSRTFDHYLASNGGVGLYAIDFLVSMGTAVHASRSGLVVAVEERFSDDDHADFHENWIMIRHADETVARYMHLTENGALVNVGDAVAQGQLIGRSGNSGPSNAPHLHFDVQTCGPNLPPGYNRPPCGMTVPVSFRNTEPHACGLQARRSYAVLPFKAES